MEPFQRLTSRAAPLPQPNIDTDIILPARFLLHTERAGLGRFAFFDWRDGGGFVLDLPAWRGAQILVAGDNFGCGSSREHAPWALHDLGIRCIIATGFGEIFRANMLRNGMVPVTLPPREWQLALASAQRAEPITVDLVSTAIMLANGTDIEFDLAETEREALLKGWDEVDGILALHSEAIASFERGQREAAPWLWNKDPVYG